MRHLLRTAVLVAMIAFSACHRADPLTAGHPPDRVVSGERVLMGTRFSIQVVTPDESLGAQAIAAAFGEVARIEALISEWREDSEISEVNRNAGLQPTAVGPELFEVVRAGIAIGDLTGGAFDLTFASCGRLWSFDQARRPSDEELSACLHHVDYRRIALDEAAGTILLLDPESRLGVGGIGKGYGVDGAAAVLEGYGFHNYLVEGGGDLRLSGERLGRPWSVGIAHPREPGRLLGSVSIRSGAVVTSGDYERFFEQDGVRYHHILDPATGAPARRAIAVTLVGPDATTADALATGILVLGPRAGLELVERLASVDALVVAPDLSLSWSSGFSRFFGPADDPPNEPSGDP